MSIDQPVDAAALVLFVILWTMARPEITGPRIVALGIVLGDAVLMSGRYEPVGVLLAPLALIWFSEMLAGIRGMVGHGAVITAETPGWMVAGFGWMVLLTASGFVLYACTVRKEIVPLTSSRPAPVTALALRPAVSTPATPEPLPREVILTAPVELPVSVHSTRSGSVILPRGTRVQLVSVGGDSVVVRYLESSATVPLAATDLSLASP